MTKAACVDWRWWALGGLVGLALLLGGCLSHPTLTTTSLDQTSPALASERPQQSAFGEISGPAETLALEMARWLEVDARQTRLAVTTFVDVNDLTRTSAFGRALTDSLMAFLHRQGFEVMELRKTASLLIQPRTGEFYLSREMVHLAAQQEISAVVVGTYTEALNVVLVSARLISAVDGQVLSTSLLELSKTPNLVYLLGGQGAGLAQAQPTRRTPLIPPAEVGVLERQPKGSAKRR